MPAALYDHEKLRAWRDASGLTRTQASNAVGIAYPTLTDLESRSLPQPPHLTCLCGSPSCTGTARRAAPGRRRMSAEPAAEPTAAEAAEAARAERIAAVVDAAPPPSKALLDRLYVLLAPRRR